MNWINVLYNHNQEYIVKESAILNAIKNVFSEIKHSKLLTNPRLDIDDQHSNLDIYLSVQVNNNKENLYSCVEEITNLIEHSVKLLIDKKPRNIQICLNNPL
ncbi:MULTISPECIES: MMB_0454 family protein [unclassified Mycoplasma]|uniref:MMB_0454 family protein n=1 Tax=unclassified Mycoplasma TaxID=2683645 RepID=UPI00211B8C69|nr:MULTISPECIES: hypothetical protein [unclassified Mycoplasma]UUM20056.1 hypothetical protein NPA11_01360 [Mycoplasma sp. 1578d]UUM25036.1 hypothetical protein NPA12_01335 [Mycoplasma sp. 3686d]